MTCPEFRAQPLYCCQTSSDKLTALLPSILKGSLQHYNVIYLHPTFSKAKYWVKKSRCKKSIGYDCKYMHVNWRRCIKYKK